MRDRGESGTSMENPNDFYCHFDDEQHFRGDPRGNPRGDPRGDLRGHRAPFDDWMTGGGRGRHRATMMMSDPSGMSYGMDHGRFGFGGRGGGRRGHGGWFGFGGRGGGKRGHGRHGRSCGRCMVDDDDEHVTSIAEQMNECQLNERCKRDGSGSNESSSSSSSSESDDEQHAPDDDVQERQPHDGEVLETAGKSTDQAQQEATQSNVTGPEKEQPSSDHSCNHGYHRRRHGRGHHKHHHGKDHHHHHHHRASDHYMIPPPLPPHPHGFNRPPFPPMHHPHHGFPDCHGNRHKAKKFFKKSMKKWYKAEKRAWKQQQGIHCCHRVQRSDEDEAATSGCDNDADIVHPEAQCQLPPPWLFFSDDHHGCGHGRRGFCRHGKKGKKHGKRLRQCKCGRPRPAEDNNAQTATKSQVHVVDDSDVEKENDTHDHDECEGDQAPMEETAE